MHSIIQLPLEYLIHNVCIHNQALAGLKHSSQKSWIHKVLAQQAYFIHCALATCSASY